MKVKGSFVSENICLCVPPQWVPSVLCMCSVTVSRSTKEKEIGSTWVMIWNTANWLSDRLIRCLSLLLCPFVFLYHSACHSFQFVLSCTFSFLWPLRGFWFVSKSLWAIIILDHSGGMCFCKLSTGIQSATELSHRCLWLLIFGHVIWTIWSTHFTPVAELWSLSCPKHITMFPMFFPTYFTFLMHFGMCLYFW